MSVCVFPRPSSATDATKRRSRHTGGLSIVIAKGVFRIMASFRRCSYSVPYERTVVGHFYMRNGLIFRIPSVYYALDFTRAVNLYAHVYNG